MAANARTMSTRDGLAVGIPGSLATKKHKRHKGVLVKLHFVSFVLFCGLVKAGAVLALAVCHCCCEADADLSGHL